MRKNFFAKFGCFMLSLSMMIAGNAMSVNAMEETDRIPNDVVSGISVTDDNVASSMVLGINGTNSMTVTLDKYLGLTQTIHIKTSSGSTTGAVQLWLYDENDKLPKSGKYTLKAQGMRNNQPVIVSAVWL